MSKIKELRNNPHHNINFVDAIQFFFPDLKSKYVDLFIRILEKDDKVDDNYIEFYHSHFPHLTKDKFEGMNMNYLLVQGAILSAIAEQDRWTVLGNFCKYNERGLIPDNDLSKINTVEQMTKLVSIAEMKLVDKEMASQVIKIHEDDTWLFLKPLTPSASKKYGSNTKWCTTSEDRDYFWNYTKRGVLVYCINKITGLKVAIFKDFDENELSFWNEEDKRIDSFISGIPYELVSTIINHIEENKVTNYSLLSEEKKLEYEKRNRNSKRRPEPINDIVGDRIDEGEMPMPMANEAHVHIGVVGRPVDNGMLRGLIPPQYDEEMGEDNGPSEEIQESLDHYVHDMINASMADEARTNNG